VSKPVFFSIQKITELLRTNSMVGKLKTALAIYEMENNWTVCLKFENN